MANADEFCQYARFGQTSKIQKCLQIHSVDINALNLYGESALSTATYYNQILTVEYLLTNKADPKLRLSAGHTAVHIACRMANIPLLNLLLSIKKGNETAEEQQKKEDKHMYECFRIKDHADLTPIHWAATQESVSKRQKLFAYLDRRMPGILESRYNLTWFQSWAETHPWVIEPKSTNNTLPSSSVRLLPKLMNTDRVNLQYCDHGSSLPLTNVTSLDMTPRVSLHDYERISRLPGTATTNGYYDDIYEKNKHSPLKVEPRSPAPILPVTPLTSCMITSTHQISKPKRCAPSTTQKPSPIGKTLTQKTPYTQKLSSIIKHPLSPESDHSTYRAQRAHVIPTFHFPPSPTSIETKLNKEHDYEDMITPISCKRPSHNLLSNIVPSTTTPSSDRSSQQSSKPFASFGFDTSLDPRVTNDTITLSTYKQNDDESLDEEEIDDYLCQSASTLGISTPGAYNYNV